MKSPGLRSLEQRNPTPPAQPRASAEPQPLRQQAVYGGGPDTGRTPEEPQPNSSNDSPEASSLASRSTAPQSSRESNPASAGYSSRKSDEEWEHRRWDPSQPPRRPTREDREELSPEELRVMRESFGTQALLLTPDYGQQLPFPADCYQEQINGLRELTTEAKALIQNAETKGVLDQDNKAMAALGSQSWAESWAGQNIWALPAEEPNKPQDRSYGLIWGLFPEGETPNRHSQWHTEEPILKTPGLLFTVTLDPFPPSPDLWAQVGLGVFKIRRCFTMTRVAEPED